MNQSRSISITFTAQELEALSKTIGIAIDNLANKSEKFSPHTDMGRVARQDRVWLSACRSLVADALSEWYATESDE